MTEGIAKGILRGIPEDSPEESLKASREKTYGEIPAKTLGIIRKELRWNPEINP